MPWGRTTRPTRRGDRTLAAPPTALRPRTGFDLDQIAVMGVQARGLDPPAARRGQRPACPPTPAPGPWQDPCSCPGVPRASDGSPPRVTIVGANGEGTGGRPPDRWLGLVGSRSPPIPAGCSRRCPCGAPTNPEPNLPPQGSASGRPGFPARRPVASAVVCCGGCTSPRLLVRLEPTVAASARMPAMASSVSKPIQLVARRVRVPGFGPLRPPGLLAPARPSTRGASVRRQIVFHEAQREQHLDALAGWRRRVDLRALEWRGQWLGPAGLHLAQVVLADPSALGPHVPGQCDAQRAVIQRARSGRRQTAPSVAARSGCRSTEPAGGAAAIGGKRVQATRIGRRGAQCKSRRTQTAKGEIG